MAQDKRIHAQQLPDELMHGHATLIARGHILQTDHWTGQQFGPTEQIAHAAQLIYQYYLTGLDAAGLETFIEQLQLQHAAYHKEDQL